ncbi:hypothetical protein B0A53_05321 [Rhodotorula sp. CCFEE 5036]|nr:hypothetical protein B0A53_05321 [Rhodotorula sp. CCFEE 5036]
MLKTNARPLAGIRVLELAGLAPTPFAGRVLERLGLDPKELLEQNPRLIIARLTGFRREGPYSHMAGHDINYLALSGVLSMLGRKGEKPYAPANTLADFAGGGLMAVAGILVAIIERAQSGKGQLVEVDMVTGTRYAAIFPLTVSHPAAKLPMWDRPRGENALDGGAPWYDVYECKDGRYMSVGAIENHFYAEFLRIFLGALPQNTIAGDTPRAEQQLDRATWPRLADVLAVGFRTRTRDEWTATFLGTDACCVPVLEPLEVDDAGRGPNESGVGAGNADSSLIGYPSPAPRLGRTPATAPAKGNIFLRPGCDSADVLSQAGFVAEEVQALVKQGAVGASGDKSRL